MDGSMLDNLCDYHQAANMPDEPNENKSPFSRLARSRLQWGVVQMPSEWHRKLGHEEFVGRLRFGVQEDNVQPPVPGYLYA